ERQSIKAMLTGSIASLGSQYVLTLNAINAISGDTLAIEQAQISRKEDVLNGLGSVTAKLREKLGESLASVQKFDKPLEEATTSSLEALKAYSQGREARNRGDEERSLNFFKRAIELDPNFAMAYANLGTAYGNLGQQELNEQNLKKAFDLRERASEREK